MTEFDGLPGSDNERFGGAVSAETRYRNAHYTLSEFTKRLVGVDDADELLRGVVGLGHALDTAIRVNGAQVRKRGLENPGVRFSLQIPLDQHRSDRGRLIATTDGTTVSLFEKPRSGDTPDPSRLPPESTFLAIPVNDIDWKRPDAETPAIRIGTQRKQFPTQEPGNGLLQQVFAATLRQDVERVVQAARQPQTPASSK